MDEAKKSRITDASAGVHGKGGDERGGDGDQGRSRAVRERGGDGAARGDEVDEVDRELGLQGGFSLGILLETTRLCAQMAFKSAQECLPASS